MDWGALWTSVVTSGVFAAVLATVGYIVKQATTAAIKNRFDSQIERVRAEIRSNERRIEALRAGALANLSSRHETIDRRRLQAIETLWQAAIKEKRYRFIVSAMQILKVSEINKASYADREKLTLLGDILFKAAGIDEKNIKSANQSPSADTERLFVPPAAWAAFNALRAINAQALAYVAMIKSGAPASIIKDATDVNKIVEMVLPHQKPFLETFPDSGIFYLVDEIEELLFREFSQALNMPTNDAELVARASAIIDAADGMIADQTLVPDSLKVDTKAAAALAESLRK